MRQPSRARLAAVFAVAMHPAVAAAQKPDARTAVAVSAHLATPARLDFTPALLRRLVVPAGFTVGVFATGAHSPRMIAVGDDGTVYVTSRDSGDVMAYRDVDGDGRAEYVKRVVSNMPHVHGIALHGGRMYLVTIHEVYALDMRGDGTVGEPRLLIKDLPDAGQHANRTIAFGPDGMMYLTVGSTCNVCVEDNEENATILRAKPDGSDRVVFARGLRNTIGFGWHPTSGDMWGFDHGFDWAGDAIPPEELNKLQSGGEYGWPYCWGAQQGNQFHPAQPPNATKAEYCKRTAAPVLTLPAHSAPIQAAFYTGTQFPAAYRNDLYVAMRGSWNRAVPSGYKIVRVHFENGQPAGSSDFLSGFVAADGATYFARPAGLAVQKDGSMLLTDDTDNVIYRVSYTGAAKGAE
jgi:glucose/arabinose dehydrogenase